MPAASTSPRRSRGKNYVIFMGDMYGRDVRPKDNKEAQAATKPLYADRPLLRKRVVAAFDQLKALAAKHAAPIDASRFAAIGFCFGGTSVLDLALTGSDIAAVVSFHGGLGSDDPALAKSIKARVLAVNGGDDRGTMPDAPSGTTPDASPARSIISMPTAPRRPSTMPPKASRFRNCLANASPSAPRNP